MCLWDLEFKSMFETKIFRVTNLASLVSHSRFWVTCERDCDRDHLDFCALYFSTERISSLVFSLRAIHPGDCFYSSMFKTRQRNICFVLAYACNSWTRTLARQPQKSALFADLTHMSFNMNWIFPFSFSLFVTRMTLRPIDYFSLTQRAGSFVSKITCRSTSAILCKVFHA